MIGVSAGTAVVLGFRNARCDVFPRIAYLMLGQRCSQSCKFCSQGHESSARARFLSRISWPQYPGQEVIERLDLHYRKGRIGRACFQIVNNPEILLHFGGILSQLRKISEIPVGISCNCVNRETIMELFSKGLDDIAIPLDAATLGIYEDVKSRGWDERLELLKWAAAGYRGKVSTHLIAGLGETEEEIVKTIELLYDNGIRVALFAFTPLPGTRLQDKPAPSLGRYRRVQLAHFIIKHRLPIALEYKRGELLFRENIRGIDLRIDNGEPFETSGCRGCNRPFYNEKPGKIPYNYPRKLTGREAQEAFATMFL